MVMLYRGRMEERIKQFVEPQRCCMGLIAQKRLSACRL